MASDWIGESSLGCSEHHGSACVGRTVLVRLADRFDLNFSGRSLRSVRFQAGLLLPERNRVPSVDFQDTRFLQRRSTSDLSGIHHRLLEHAPHVDGASVLRDHDHRLYTRGDPVRGARPDPGLWREISGVSKARFDAGAYQVLEGLRSKPWWGMVLNSTV